MIYGVESFAEVYCSGYGSQGWFVLIETCCNVVGELVKCCDCGMFVFETVLVGWYLSVLSEVWEYYFLYCFGYG